jgi:hypothetical protein
MYGLLPSECGTKSPLRSSGISSEPESQCGKQEPRLAFPYRNPRHFLFTVSGLSSGAARTRSNSRAFFFVGCSPGLLPGVGDPEGDTIPASEDACADLASARSCRRKRVDR